PRKRTVLQSEALRALPFDVDPANPARAGWGVLWAAGSSKAVRDALQPLVQRRKTQVEGDRFHEIELKPADNGDALPTRFRVGGGAIEPSSFPYYVLIVGGPDAVSWDLQRDLSPMCAVGRLAFRQAAEFDRYARAVVDAETAAPATRRQFACWGTRHLG